MQRKEARKLKARSRHGRGVWFGLGMFGLIGWSVALPALAGVALGAWIDRTWPSRYSWTLMLLLGGIILGCAQRLALGQPGAQKNRKRNERTNHGNQPG